MAGNWTGSSVFGFLAHSGEVSNRLIACSHEQDNLYMFDYRSEISDAIGSNFDIDFTRKRLLLSEIKNILANSKK